MIWTIFLREIKMKSNKIVFQSVNTDLDFLKPEPSTKNVPSWYRKMDGVIDGIQTVKKCVPFLDSLSMGYQIPLVADIHWHKDIKEFHSDSKIDLVSDHFLSQSKDVEIPEGFDPQPHKWNNFWHIKTPKGYSTLFIHPLNRMDLPFYSFSGVVDTDKHPLVINFPFVLKSDFDGDIKAGTPLIQAIPFKRDSWSSKILDQGLSYDDQIGYEVSKPPFGWYKRNHWTRKEYR